MANRKKEDLYADIFVIIKIKSILLKGTIMEAIKPGPNPKKDNGKDDKRRRIAPATKSKNPDLKIHIHKSKD